MAGEWVKNTDTGEWITYDTQTGQWVGQEGATAKGFDQPPPIPTQQQDIGGKAIGMTEKATESLGTLVSEAEGGLQYGAKKLAGQVSKKGYQTATALGRRAPSIPQELLGQEVAQNQYLEKKAALVAQVNQGLLQGAANMMTAQGLAQEQQRDLFAIFFNIYETLKTTILDDENQVQHYWGKAGKISGNIDKYKNKDGTLNVALITSEMAGEDYAYEGKQKGPG